MMRQRLLVIFIILVFFLPTAAFSADDPGKADYTVYDLGEIVVSEENPVVKDVAVINEVTAEDIKATNSRTVDEALQYVPGVRVSTGRKDEPEISIHGFSQKKVLILIDGVPYYETKYGKLHMNEIPTDNIAKIEVAKGAPSVLYGPNAEIGVINIITKKATEKPSASVNIELGERDYNRVAVAHGMKKGILSYWLNYVHSEREAWKLSEDFEPKTGQLRRRPGGTSDVVFEDGGNFRDNSDSKSDSIWAKVGLEFDEAAEYYVNFHYITSEKGQPSSIYANSAFSNFTQLARWNKYDNYGVDLSGKQKITDNFTLKAKLFYHNHEDDYVSYYDETYSQEVATSTYKDYMLGGSLFADYVIADWNTLRGAFHYRKDSHKQRDEVTLPFEKSISLTGSVALEDEIKPIKNFSIVAGVSYEWFDVTDAESTSGSTIVEETTPDTKDTFNPMIGLTYTFADSTKLFGSVAKKTRFPTLDQLYSSSSGNQNLDAEQSINYTLGVSRTFADIIAAEVAFFHHDISDWITRDCIAGEDTYQNWDKVKMYGVEVNSELFLTADLTLKLGYTYNYARNKGANRVTDLVVNVPEHEFDMGVSYIVPVVKTKMNVTGIYMARTYSDLPTPADPTAEETESDDYWLFNARITQPITKYFEAYVAGSNLFDNDYESEYGYPGRGREIWIGLTAKY